MDCDPQSVPRKIKEAVHIRNSSGPSLMNRDSDLEIFYMWDTLFVKTLSSTPVHLMKEPERALKHWYIKLFQEL